MGKRLVIAAMVVMLLVGGSIVPSGDRAEAQAESCVCYAGFDAIDSDLQFVGQYYNSTSATLSVDECGPACDTWRRDWFYGNACDYPRRINRARNAYWGFDNGVATSVIGPETWWCPFPPP
jgi:hypothetical protein